MAIAIEIVWKGGRRTCILDTSLKTDFAPYDSMADMLELRFDRVLEDRRLRLEVRRCEPKPTGDPKQYNAWDDEESGPIECVPYNEYYVDFIVPEEFDEVLSISYFGTPLFARINGEMIDLEKVRNYLDESGQYETKPARYVDDLIFKLKDLIEDQELNISEVSLSCGVPAGLLETD